MAAATIIPNRRKLNRNFSNANPHLQPNFKPKIYSPFEESAPVMPIPVVDQPQYQNRGSIEYTINSASNNNNSNNHVQFNLPGSANNNQVPVTNSNSFQLPVPQNYNESAQLYYRTAVPIDNHTNDPVLHVPSRRNSHISINNNYDNIIHPRINNNHQEEFSHTNPLTRQHTEVSNLSYGNRSIRSSYGDMINTEPQYCENHPMGPHIPENHVCRRSLTAEEKRRSLNLQFLKENEINVVRNTNDIMRQMNNSTVTTTTTTTKSRTQTKLLKFG